MSKYYPLETYLSARSAEFVPMTFADVERVLGFQLPASKVHRAWWSNNPSNNVMTNAWLNAGYRTTNVDVGHSNLVFRRTARNQPGGGGTGADDGAPGLPHGPRRHPLFGRLKGLLAIKAGTDLTKPADPTWGDQE